MRGPNLPAFCAACVVLVLISPGLQTMPADAASGSFGGGSGTLADPYIIEDVWDLQNMSADPDAHYIIANDIDASETATWSSGAGFEPVGNDSSPFTGTLDGRNHTVRGLHINSTLFSGIGLLGAVGEGASVVDLRVEDLDIYSDARFCGLVGENRGTMANCHVSGMIRGYAFVGAVAGYNLGNISVCSASGNVSGSIAVGGLVGVSEDGAISDSWSLAEVTGIRGVGGLVGSLRSGRIHNSHYSVDDVLTNGGHHLTPGGLFSGQYGSWITDRRPLDISDYGSTLVPSGSTYEISSAQGLRDLLGFADVETYEFRLGADLDLSADPELYIPYLAGRLDGANHTISNLSLKLPYASNVGFVGLLAGGVVTRLGLLECELVEGCMGQWSGGLVARNELGTIADSYVTGTVTSNWSAGGLVCVNNGVVSGCFATANVTGDEHVAGLVGYNDVQGNVSDSYAMGWATGKNRGGLVGTNYGQVSRSYYAGTSNSGLVGGIRNYGDVYASFWDNETAAPSSSHGGVGKCTADMKTQSTFTDAGWDFNETWCMAEGVTYPLHRWQDRKPPTADAGLDMTVDEGTLVALDGTGSRDDTAIANYTWTFTDGFPVTLYGNVLLYKFNNPGTRQVTLTVTDTVGNQATDVMTVTVRDITPPVADAGPDVTIDQRETAYFDGSHSRDNIRIVNWTWTIKMNGWTVVLYGRWCSYQFDFAGTFAVELNVTDAAGLWATDVAIVTVRDTTAPWIPSGQDYTVDQHESLTFDSSGFWDNVGIVNWTWNFTYLKQPVTLHGPAPTWVFDVAGSYKVWVTVRDAVGNEGSGMSTVNVLDRDPPSARAGDDVTVDQGGVVRLDGSASTDNRPIRNWTWTFEYGGDAVELPGETVDFRFDLAGVYRVTLTVTDLEGNAGQDELVVTVADTEPPWANAGPDMSVDQHTTATFDGSWTVDNVGISDLTWTFEYYGTPVVLHGPHPEFTFEDAGTYEVVLTAADAAGNVDTDTVNVTVVDTTPPTAVAGPDLAVDQGRELALDGRGSVDNVAVVNWTWAFEYRGTPQTLWGPTPRVTLTTPGTYEVTLTVADAAGNTGTTTVTVRVRDKEPPTAVAGRDVTARPGEEVLLDGSRSADNVNVVRWTWTFRDGGKDVTLEGMMARYAFRSAGDYEVTLTVEDAEGNAGTDTFIVTVKGFGGSSGTTSLILVVVAAAIVVVGAVVVLQRRKRPQT